MAVDGDVAPVPNLLRQEGGVAVRERGNMKLCVCVCFLHAEIQKAKINKIGDAAKAPLAYTYKMNLGLKKVYLRFLVRKPKSRARLKSDMACKGGDERHKHLSKFSYIYLTRRSQLFTAMVNLNS